MMRNPTSGRALRSLRTRARILEAAEDRFAQLGFAGTRVEAIARQAGIRRASLFYHFRDKSEIYDEVLRKLFDPLQERMRKLFERGLGEQLIEPAISELFDFLAERPRAARIILREIADAEPRGDPPLLRHAGGILCDVEELLRPLRGAGVDPLRLMLTVIGAAVFFVTTTPLLTPIASRNPGEEVRRHKVELSLLVRRQLGLGLSRDA